MRFENLNDLKIIKEEAELIISAIESELKLLTSDLKKAEDNLTENSILASDAFFPFSDSIDLANKYNIKTIIQPGGSIRDNEVIEKADEFKLKMIFTNQRHFSH